MMYLKIKSIQVVLDQWSYIILVYWIKAGFIVNKSLFYGIIGYTNSKLKDLSNANPFTSKNHSGSKIGFGLRHKLNKKNYLLFEYAKKIYSPVDVVSVDTSGVAASKSSKDSNRYHQHWSWLQVLISSISGPIHCCSEYLSHRPNRVGRSFQ